MSAFRFALSWRGGWTTSTGLVEQHRPGRSGVVNRGLDTRLVDAYECKEICNGGGADCHDEPVDVDRWAPRDITAR
jgi:hypothetical protein